MIGQGWPRTASRFRGRCPGAQRGGRRQSSAAARRAADLLGDALGRQVGKPARRHLQRRGQPRLVLGLRDLDGAEARQMRRQELRVAQHVAAQPQPRDQMHQRHLRGIGGAGEHAFPEERPAECHAIQPADQPPFRPGLDRMGIAAAMQFDEQAFDLGIDPGVGAPGRRFGAAADGAGEVAVGGHGEAVGQGGAAQPARQVEAGIDRQHPAQRGVEPIHPVRPPALGHREDPHGIGADHQVGRDLKLPAAHGWSLHQRPLAPVTLRRRRGAPPAGSPSPWRSAGRGRSRSAPPRRGGGSPG